MSELNDLVQSNGIENKRKYLFLRQVEMLDGFLKNGAITLQQYEFSYSGLVEKMKITKEELAEWMGDSK